MIEFDEYKVKLNNIRPKLDALADSLGIEAAKEEIDRLHAQIDSEGFWDNQEISQKVISEFRAGRWRPRSRDTKKCAASGTICIRSAKWRWRTTTTPCSPN